MSNIPKNINLRKSSSSKIFTYHSRTLQEAISRVPCSSIVPAKEIAQKLGISYSRLMSSTRIFPGGIFKFPVRRILPLLLAAKNFLPLEFLAEQCNCVLVKLPVVNEAGVDIFISTVRTQEAWHRLSLHVQNLYARPIGNKDKTANLEALLDRCSLLISEAAQLRADVGVILNERREGEESVKRLRDSKSR